MKFTEGLFRDVGYQVATSEFREQCVTERESWIIDNLDRKAGLSAVDNAKAIEPGYDMMTDAQQKAVVAEVEGVVKAIGKSHGGGKWKSKLMVKDTIADITLQQVLTRADSFDVIATMNLNGDYLSDALAAQASAAVNMLCGGSRHDVRCAGWRNRYCTRWQHQLQDGPRHL
jgi:isocitrate dehydrogenase